MKNKQNQSGFALLMLVVVLLGLVMVGLSRILGSSVIQQNEKHRAENRKVLLEAKEALLSYAVDYRVRDLPLPGGDGEVDLYRMGKLPCPDTAGSLTNEGSQDPICGGTSANTIGYFPYKTVGKGKLEDSANECLWYIVSGDYKNSPASDLLNWDTVGYLNLVDENGNVKHGVTEDDYPVAFIISPGSNFGQNREPIITLPQCRSNYNLSSYLEGGPNIDYASDLPGNDDTLWEVLTTSESANLEGAEHNDQVIAIYREELWDRIERLGDLFFDNSDINPGTEDPVNSSIEELTRALAECVAVYGNDNEDRLPFPAPVNLLGTGGNNQNEYRFRSFYDDDDNDEDGNPLRFGRFPQVVDSSAGDDEDDFVFDTGAGDPLSYCDAVVATDYDEKFWDNWKDHFFYIVSEDFDSDSSVIDANKCTGIGNSVGCAKIRRLDGSERDIAAVVIFAGRAQADQSRIFWWDRPNGIAAVDEKADVTNYLEGDPLTGFQTGYAGGNKAFTLENTDYAWCVEFDGSNLEAIKCADL